MDDVNRILWNKSKKHRGHNVDIVSYGDWDNQMCIRDRTREDAKAIFTRQSYVVNEHIFYVGIISFDGGICKGIEILSLIHI